MSRNQEEATSEFIGGDVDADREDQLKIAEIDSENQVKKMLNIVESISKGEDDETEMMKLIHLIQEFQKQYEWICSSYQDLKDEMKKHIDDDDDSCYASSNSDNESFYTPMNTRNKPFSRVSPEASYAELSRCSREAMKRSGSIGSLSEPSSVAVGIPPEDLEKRVVDLKLDVTELCIQKRGLEEKLEDKTKEEHTLLARIRELEIRGSEDRINELEHEIQSLRSRKVELEDESLQIHLENEKLKPVVAQLQISVDGKEAEITSQQKKLKSMEEEVKNLKNIEEILLIKLESLQLELDNKIADHNKAMIELERKTDEKAEELRKLFEDQFILLSRRIRVAEQLQVELKEWYRMTKEAHTIPTKNLKQLDDLLTSFDSVGLKFEECAANFLNRISKASCEMNFVKEWAARKNKAASNVKDEMDRVFVELDEKEAEVLSIRERLWRSENKVRELEKMSKENEDTVLGLMEEKREAIRQLCVWIDYHRARSDYYKKTLSEIVTKPGH